MLDQHSRNTELWAKAACVYSGIAWGLFWIPLRWLEEVGIQGAWIGLLFFVAQLILMAPIQILRGHPLLVRNWDFHLTTLCAGSSIAFYALAVVYTTVINAMLLFYMTAVWSTLLAWIVFKQPITWVRASAIAFGFAGMFIIFKLDTGNISPLNSGDILAFGSGILWAIAAVRLRGNSTADSGQLCYGFYLWGVVACIFGLLIPLGFQSTAPTTKMVSDALIWLVPLLAVIAIPGAWAAMWGPKFVDPGLVGILFMSEIIVGSITVALWAGEPFGVRQVFGILLIMTAGVLESAVGYIRGRRILVG